MHCSIGLTTTGKDIFLDTAGWIDVSLEETYKSFNDMELLEALLAIEVLHLQEIRRKSFDSKWLDSMNTAEIFISDKLGEESTLQLKALLGITSAFKGFAYGQKLLHWNFRRTS